MFRRGPGEAHDAPAEVVEVSAEFVGRTHEIPFEQLQQIHAVRGQQEEHQSRRRAVQGRDEGEEHGESGEFGQLGSREAGVKEEQRGPGHRVAVLVSGTNKTASRSISTPS